MVTWVDCHPGDPGSILAWVSYYIPYTVGRLVTTNVRSSVKDLRYSIAWDVKYLAQTQLNTVELCEFKL